MQSVTFDVPGKPQGKARARTFYNRRLQRNMSMTPENTVLYENLIKGMYLNAADGTYFEAGKPVKLEVTAKFVPTASTSKKKRTEMLEGRIKPLKKPDIDNIVKVVADALNGVAYKDDTQIIYAVAKKEHADTEGLSITVTAIDSDENK